MKVLGIRIEYIQNHTPEDNGDIEYFHNGIKTDYIWPNEFRNYHEASPVIERAFTDYNEFRPHSSIDYHLPREFRRMFLNDASFRGRFEEKEMEVSLDEK